MSIKLPIQYFSQFSDVVPEDLKKTICSLACIKMVIDYVHESDIDINEIIKERDFLAVRLPEYGSSHAGVAIILRNHGVMAYAQEFKSHSVNTETGEATSSQYEQKFIEKSLEKIAINIADGMPVIASVTHKELKTPHQALVYGFKGEKGNPEGFYIHDPHTQNESLVSTEGFKKDFRNMAIFTEK